MEKKSRKKSGLIESLHIIIIIIAVLFIGGFVAALLMINKVNSDESTENYVIIPNVTGMTKEEAIKTLEIANLKYEIAEESSDEFEAGYIISQDPIYQSNYPVKKGTTINLIVSLGIEEVIVPKVIGMKQEEAIETLENEKLKYEVVEESSKKVEAGYVISQETDEGMEVEVGDTIVIHVSTGV